MCSPDRSSKIDHLDEALARLLHGASHCRGGRRAAYYSAVALGVDDPPHAEAFVYAVLTSHLRPPGGGTLRRS